MSRTQHHAIACRSIVVQGLIETAAESVQARDNSAEDRR